MNTQTIKCSVSAAMNSDTKSVFTTKDIKVTRVLIPVDYEHASIKFFVDNNNGESYGSYDSEADAVELATEMQRVLN